MDTGHSYIPPEGYEDGVQDYRAAWGGGVGQGRFTVYMDLGRAIVNIERAMEGGLSNTDRAKAAKLVAKLDTLRGHYE
jgi:hypothetical protein